MSLMKTSAHRDISFVSEYSLLNERNFDVTGYQGIATVRLGITIMSQEKCAGDQIELDFHWWRSVGALSVHVQ